MFSKSSEVIILNNVKSSHSSSEMCRVVLLHSVFYNLFAL